MSYPPIPASGAAPSSTAPATFNALMDAMLAYIASLPGNLNAFGSYIDTLGAAIDADASSAATNAGIAGTAATNAGNSATAAHTSELNAATAAANATNAANVAGTSTTSNAIPASVTGSKSFVFVEANRAISVGMYLLCADTAAPSANTITIQVTAWNAGTQTVTGDVVAFQGSGTKTAWSISLTGKPGAAGATGAAGSVSLARKLITGTDTLVAADLGKVVKCSGTVDYTVTPAAAATLGANWFVSLSNEGTGIVTLSAASIDGATTKLVQPGDALFIQCNGTDLVTQRIDGDGAFGTVSAGTVLASVSSNSFVGCCALTATNGFVLRVNASNFPIVDYVDATGAIVATSAALESTTVSAAAISVYMERISNTDALIVWSRGTGAPVACVVRYSAGFTIGAVLALDTASNAAGGAVLSTTEAVVAWGNSTAGVVKATVLSISGTGLTLNTVYTIDSGSYTTQIRLAKISATQVIAHYNLGSDTSAALGKVLTNAATVLTFPAAADSLYRVPTSAGGMGDIAALSTPASRALVVGGTGSGAPGRAVTIDATGTGTTAKLNRNLPKLVAPAETSGQIHGNRLIVINPLAVVRLSTMSDSASLVLSALKLRPDGGVRECPASASIARKSTAAGIMLLGTTLVVVYADADNSQFPTIKTVALGTVA